MLDVDDIHGKTETGWVTALDALNRVNNYPSPQWYVDRLMHCVDYWLTLPSYDPDSEPIHAYKRATSSFAKDVLRLAAAVELYPARGIRSVRYEKVDLRKDHWDFALVNDVENKAAWWTLVYQALDRQTRSLSTFKESAVDQNYVYDFFTAYPTDCPIQDLIRDRLVTPSELFSSMFYDTQQRHQDPSVDEAIASL
jgi:hypothetical protein